MPRSQVTDFAPQARHVGQSTQGGFQALDVPEILFRQPASLFHTHAGEEVAQILDMCRLQQKRVHGNRRGRGDAAACWEQRRSS